MIRVCLLGDSSSKSGVGKYIRTLASTLAPARFDVSVLNSEELHVRTVCVANGEAGVGAPLSVAESLPVAGSLRALRLMAGYARELVRVARLMKRQTPAGALLHVNHMGCEVDAVAARWLGYRHVVGTLHVLPGSDPASRFWVRRIIEYVSLRSVSHRIAISEAVAAAWSARVQLAPDKCTVIYNGVEPALDPPRTYSMETGRRDLVLGTTGRLHPLKGQDSLMRAFALLPEDLRARTRLVYVGDGPYRETLVVLARELGITDRVQFAGYLDDPRLASRKFDVFISASRYEGMSLSLAEAMMDGLPCVITESGGMSELIRKSKGGLMVPIGNDVLLAHAMEFYLEHPEARELDGLKAREFARQHLTAEAMCERTAQLYETMLR